MLWEIAMADRVVHEFESNLVWRVAELLGVSARDRVLMRKTVASRLAWRQRASCRERSGPARLIVRRAASRPPFFCLR